MKTYFTLLILLGISLPRVHSQSPEEIVIKALTFAQNQNYDSALYTYNLGIEKYPDLPMLYVLKGEFLANMNRRLTSDGEKYAKAVKEFNKALEIDSTFYPAYSSRGLLNIFHQKYDLAINDFSSALRYARDPEDQFNALADLGSAKLYAKDYEGAIKIYNKALEIKPGALGILINLATLQMNLQNYEEAEKTFKQALDVDSSNVNLLNNFALMYIKMGKYNQAIEKLEKALSLEPNQPYAYNNLGFAKVKTGEVKKGLELINKSISMYPDNSYAFKNRAIAHIALGMTEKACQDLKKANELGYSHTFDGEVNDLLKENCK